MDRRNVSAIAIIAILIGSVLAAVAFPIVHSQDKSFVIVHTNDTHCHYDDDGSAGFVSVAAIKDELSGVMPVFTVDAGDFLSGSAYGNVTKGESSVTIMNAVGYDLVVPGNHEFDYGMDVFLERTRQLDFPVICANLVYKDTGDPVFDEYRIIERGGVRVGFFGLLTEETESTTKQGNMGNTETTDQTEAARRMVGFLRTQNVDRIVAVGHLGVTETGFQTSDYVCQTVPGIDIFIDGHSHTEMEDGKVCDGSIVLLPSETMIASTGCHTKNVGIAGYGSAGIFAKLYRGPQMDCPEVARVISEVEQDVDRRLETVIGSTEILLHGQSSEIRYGETNLGDLVADALVRSSGQQIGIICSGSIRTSVAIGDITLHTVYDVVPFINDTVIVNVPGSVIWKEMEFSLQNTGRGGYLQFSGMTVTYDPDGEPWQKVRSITVGGEPIGMDTEYSLVTIDFVYTGGDGNIYLMDYPMKIDCMLDESFIGYIEYLGTVTESHIHMGRLIPV